VFLRNSDKYRGKRTGDADAVIGMTVQDAAGNLPPSWRFCGFPNCSIALDWHNTMRCTDAPSDLFIKECHTFLCNPTQRMENVRQVTMMEVSNRTPDKTTCFSFRKTLPERPPDAAAERAAAAELTPLRTQLLAASSFKDAADTRCYAFMCELSPPGYIRLLFLPIGKTQGPYRERILLATKCLSPAARSVLARIYAFSSKLRRLTLSFKHGNVPVCMWSMTLRERRPLERETRDRSTYCL
jgi:hypothetical protein